MASEDTAPGSPGAEDVPPTGTLAGPLSPSRLETLSGVSFSSGDARTTIGRYRLRQRVGEGGMGEVWEAERLYRETLAMLRRVYGEEHPEVAWTTGNLGNCFAYTKGPSPSG